MPSYKLIYFPVRGRGETVRLLFAATGVEYEDCRVTGEELQKLKAEGTLPFGQLPVLVVDGVHIAQSRAILNYVAKVTGLSAKDNLECAKVDQIVEGCFDIFDKMIKIHFEKDEALKKTMYENFYTKDIFTALAFMEKLVEGENNFRSKLSLADVVFFATVDSLYYKKEAEKLEALKGYPKLKSVYCGIADKAGVKEWIAKRPDSNV